MEKINLEDEVICDYLVTKDMKKVWQCQLDMVEEFDRICNKYNIKYFLSGGTLLGAVRHGGYIPWDDDIDICMMRNEYIKFLEVAKKELDNKYFLQYYMTEDKYPRGHAQIRNSNTTAIISEDLYNKFNKGIFIDIFPMDNIPDDTVEKNEFISLLKKDKKFLSNYYNIYNKTLWKRVIKKIIRILNIKYVFCDFNKKIYNFENKVSKYKDVKTKYNGLISFLPESDQFENEWYKDTVYLKFEYLSLPCPKEYHKVLTEQYGDYMQIPENKNGSLHGRVFFDTENSYKLYESDKEKKNKLIEFFLKKGGN